MTPRPASPTRPDVTVICGGVGAARILRGLVEVVDPRAVTAVVNVGDDSVLHGLDICPDLDTITYTLADAIDPDRGWGLVEETWAAMEQLRRYGAANSIDPRAEAGNDAAGWFSLGDRDLGTHLYRTSRRAAGVPLGEVSREIARTWGVEVDLRPVSDDPVRTTMETADGRRLTFQEYFVRERHDVEIAAVHFDGATEATPGPGVIEAIGSARVVLIAPSNPVVSIDPVLAVPGVRDAIIARRDDVVAVSPIVGGAALKGPADRLLRELGHDSSATSIARWYSPIASRLVIDSVDADLAPQIQAEGIEPVVAPTIMSDRAAAAALATVCLGTGEAR